MTNEVVTVLNQSTVSLWHMREDSVASDRTQHPAWLLLTIQVEQLMPEAMRQ